MGTAHSYNVHIFLAFPELYWGHTGSRGSPAAFRLVDWGRDLGTGGINSDFGFHWFADA